MDKEKWINIGKNKKEKAGSHSYDDHCQFSDITLTFYFK